MRRHAPPRAARGVLGPATAGTGPSAPVTSRWLSTVRTSATASTTRPASCTSLGWATRPLSSTMPPSNTRTRTARRPSTASRRSASSTRASRRSPSSSVHVAAGRACRRFQRSIADWTRLVFTRPTRSAAKYPSTRPRPAPAATTRRSEIVHSDRWVLRDTLPPVETAVGLRYIA